MALPTFFIIGAPKAGTTSLHHYLDQHPEVQMSAIKEPRFFAGPENSVSFPPDYVGFLDDYERLFDPAARVRGESSTDYATYPIRTGVPERIKRSVPEAKFIYMVRDPIARTISHYKMGAALLGESRSLTNALGDLKNIAIPYLAPSLYATQLERYLDLFPQERVLVIDQADLLTKRTVTLTEIFTFLGVDKHVDPTVFEEELLTSESWRNYPAGYANFIARRIAPAVRWVPKGFRRSVRRSVECQIWPPIDTDLDQELHGRLEELFRPEATRLRELTDKTFPTWSV